MSFARTFTHSRSIPILFPPPFIFCTWEGYASVLICPQRFFQRHSPLHVNFPEWLPQASRFAVESQIVLLECLCCMLISCGTALSIVCITVTSVAFGFVAAPYVVLNIFWSERFCHRLWPCVCSNNFVSTVFLSSQMPFYVCGHVVHKSSFACLPIFKNSWLQLHT